MTTEVGDARKSAEFLSHLTRFPEDLRDIRRLQRKFGLSAAEVAIALDAWRAADGNAQRLKELLSH